MITLNIINLDLGDSERMAASKENSKSLHVCFYVKFVCVEDLKLILNISVNIYGKTSEYWPHWEWDPCPYLRGCH